MSAPTNCATDADAPSPRAEASGVIAWLDDATATDVAVVGAKGANLARSAAEKFPVLPGFAITVEGAGSWAATRRSTDLHHAWSELSGDGQRSLIVRSSSVIEDSDSSSMAGRFTSVLDVQGWAAFLDAVEEVLASADEIGDEPAPMGVVVQPLLAPDRAGVAFGANPVDGADEIVVAVVQGGPDSLVSGIESGETIRLSRRGRLHLDADDVVSDALSRHERHQLAHLIRQLDRHFGGPQDIEWAIDRDGRLWLLQTRPITTNLQPAIGPRLGPGPVAETFPTSLSTLEEDLWVPGLRDGIAEAIALSGAQTRTKVERSPVVVSIHGRLAVDLELLGIEEDKKWWRALDPRVGGQRLAAAWRVGRLRVAIADLAHHLIVTTDAQLAEVPGLETLDDEDLLSILANTRRSLTALHGHEVLAGMLLPDLAESASAAGLALAAVRRGRSAGLSDVEIVEQEPVTLGLVPPSIGAAPSFPPLRDPKPGHGHGEALVDHADASETAVDRTAVAREALRLRVRWVQELSGRTAWELARRLVRRGTLVEPGQVRLLHLSELCDAVRSGTTPPDLHERLEPDIGPLPAVFRRREDGEIVAVRSAGGAAQGAGGGRSRGPVHLGDDPPEGSVLVVQTLDPALAGVLSRLSGLIAETGSPLSHLAILARELGVATVVGYPDACSSFADGDVVVVDGASGTVSKESGTAEREVSS